MAPKPQWRVGSDTNTPPTNFERPVGGSEQGLELKTGASSSFWRFLVGRTDDREFTCMVQLCIG